MMSANDDLKRYDCFDGVRGIGAVVVVFSHLPLIAGGGLYNLIWTLEHSSRLGFLMLDQFFLMSGFFITRILLSEKIRTGRISLRNFYIRRTLRIFPIYYIAVVVVYFVFQLNSAELLSALTYTFNYYHALNPSPNPLEHTWSLSVEEQFYLFWPLLIGVIPLNIAALVTGRVVPAIAIASGLAMAVLIGNQDPVLSGNMVYMSLSTRMLSLSLGGWLAVREYQKKPLGRPQCMLLIGTGIVLLLADLSARSSGLIQSQGLYWTVALTSYAMISVAVTATLIFDFGIVASLMRRFLEFPLFRSLGGIAYALYLFHLPVLFYFGLNEAALGGEHANWLSVSKAVGITFLLAILSQYLIERPFMSLRRHFAPNTEAKVARVAMEPSA